MFPYGNNPSAYLDTRNTTMPNQPRAAPARTPARRAAGSAKAAGQGSRRRPEKMASAPQQPRYGGVPPDNVPTELTRSQLEVLKRSPKVDVVAGHTRIGTIHTDVARTFSYKWGNNLDLGATQCFIYSAARHLKFILAWMNAGGRDDTSGYWPPYPRGHRRDLEELRDVAELLMIGPLVQRTTNDIGQLIADAEAKIDRVSSAPPVAAQAAASGDGGSTVDPPQANKEVAARRQTCFGCGSPKHRVRFCPNPHLLRCKTCGGQVRPASSCPTCPVLAPPELREPTATPSSAIPPATATANTTETTSTALATPAAAPAPKEQLVPSRGYLTVSKWRGGRFDLGWADVSIVVEGKADGNNNLKVSGVGKLAEGLEKRSPLRVVGGAIEARDRKEGMFLVDWEKVERVERDREDKGKVRFEGVAVPR